MKKIPALVFDKGIGLSEFSVTSNIPSTMNGGKDFCHWSGEDRKLAASILTLMELKKQGVVRHIGLSSHAKIIFRI